MVARSLIVGTLITMMAVVGSSYRYDIFVLDDYKIKDEDIIRTERAESVCACRRRCVEDESCSAVTAVKTAKATVFECHFSETQTPTSSLEEAGERVTIFKERKPKVYFWSSNKAKSVEDDEVFSTLCSAEGGKPGVVLSWLDYQYVKNNLTAKTEYEGGFIPLKSKVTNEQTGQKHTRWIGLSFPFLDSNPLKSSYYEDQGNKEKLCHRLNEFYRSVTVEQTWCTGIQKAPVLCYKYD